jgi:hypothetical protein
MVIVLRRQGAHANLLLNFDAFEPYISSGEQPQMFTVTIPAQTAFIRFIEIKYSAAIQVFHLNWTMVKVQFRSITGRAVCQVPPVKVDRLFPSFRKGTDQQFDA